MKHTIILILALLVLSVQASHAKTRSYYEVECSVSGTPTDCLEAIRYSLKDLKRYNKSVHGTIYGELCDLSKKACEFKRFYKRDPKNYRAGQKACQLYTYYKSKEKAWLRWYDRHH